MGSSRLRRACAGAAGLSALLLSTQFTFAEDWAPIWQQASLSQARFWMSGTAVGSKVFFAGGYTGSAASNVVDIYDIDSNTWSTAALSQSRRLLAAATAGNKAMFAGGYPAGTGVDTVDIYDVTTNTWSTSTLSQARGNLSGVSVGNKAIFGGGFTGGSYSNVVDIYDGTTNTWSTAALSDARQAMAATSVGGKALFAGGYSGAANLFTNTVDIYDSASNSWTTAVLSEARGEAGAAAAGGRAYIAGGRNNAGFPNDSTKTVDFYVASSNSFGTAAQLPFPNNQLAGASAGPKAIFASGAAYIYDTNALTWSTVNLSQSRFDITAVSAGHKAIFGGGQANGASDRVDIYTSQNYPAINSTKSFTLVDHTNVFGRLQLSAGSSLNLATFNLTVGSMSGVGNINLNGRNLTAGADNSSSTYSGALSNFGFLIKQGAGVLHLSGASSHLGATTVQGGKLNVTGTIYNSPVTVNGGAALGGTGTITNGVTVAGGVAPGSRGAVDLADGMIATLLLGNSDPSQNALKLGGASAGQKSRLRFEVASAADLLFITSANLLVQSGGADIEIVPLPGFGEGTYDLIQYNLGSASGLQFLSLATTIPGYTMFLQATSTSEQLVVVPEPAAGIVGAACAAAFLSRRRRGAQA